MEFAEAIANDVPTVQVANSNASNGPGATCCFDE